MEQVAISRYKIDQHSNGHPDLTVCSVGVFVSTSHSFLGSSHDGSVYHRNKVDQPYGFIEVKFPYKPHDITPLEACKMSEFCCKLNDTIGAVTLKGSVTG